jgi:dolichol-phosphate mannosyltransferase
VPEKVRNVIIIPSYCETLALPTMLSKLQASLSTADAIIIMDDSPSEVASFIDKSCQAAMASAKINYLFINNQGKLGRGAAIQRGMKKAIKLFPEVEFIIECDADGSHRPEDILKLRNFPADPDLIIGSRYLPGSRISDWPITRRVLSYMLNKIIPKILHLDITDITNGLRRYSKSAVKEILNAEQQNKGFIYLSEQALVISNRGLKIIEIPIHFVNRVEGESTVTWREILSSIRGVVGLLRAQVKR